MNKSVPRGSAKQANLCARMALGSGFHFEAFTWSSRFLQSIDSPTHPTEPKTILRPSVLLADVDAGRSEEDELQRRRRSQPAEIAAVGPARVVGPRPRRGAEARNVDVMVSLGWFDLSHKCSTEITFLSHFF